MCSMDGLDAPFKGWLPAKRRDKRSEREKDLYSYIIAIAPVHLSGGDACTNALDDVSLACRIKITLRESAAHSQCAHQQ